MNLTQHTEEAVKLLKGLISTPSFSREEDITAALLTDRLEKAGIKPAVIKNNVWALANGFDEAKPTILLNSHHDTVKPVKGWTKDPFSPEVDGDTLFGLGSNDAGASLVCLLETFLYFSGKNKLPWNLVFLASAEEEVSGQNGVELALSKLPRIDLAIVGEPTQMNLAVAEKGLMVIDAVAPGKSGHAARDEGENAIYNALEDIEKIRNYQFENTSSFLGNVKMSVTLIEAGTQHNVVPDTCKFTIDVRTNGLYTNREVFDILQSELKSALTARSFRLNSSNISVEHPIVKKGLSMGLEAYGSPTLSDQCLMDFPSVKIGPGDSARSHTADEFILLSEIEEGIKTYIRLLDGLVI